MKQLTSFIAESNEIEGIFRPPTDEEIRAHIVFLNSDASVFDLQKFVYVVAKNHVIRDTVGLDVQVGNHIAPAGGPDIIPALNMILNNRFVGSPFEVHCQYLHLHPFTDGNGRSARALWLWMMQKAGNDSIVAKYGFLHSFYYQTLDNQDSKQ